MKRHKSASSRRNGAPPHSAPSTQTEAPPNALSADSIVNVPRDVNVHNIYVMVNTDEVPSRLESLVDIFYLYDGVRYIVGYCLPFKFYVENFGNAPAARVIKGIENVELYQEHMQRFKFVIAPLNVVPVNEVEFYAMIGSSQAEMEASAGGVLRNRFYMRPTIVRPPNEVLSSVDSSVTQSVVQRFQLNINPHLIPIRLPDGLECYIRLDLAKHCQEAFCKEELEFGYYHFREVQRDANLKPSLARISAAKDGVGGGGGQGGGGGKPTSHHQHHHQQHHQHQPQALHPANGGANASTGAPFRLLNATGGGGAPPPPPPTSSSYTTTSSSVAVSALNGSTPPTTTMMPVTMVVLPPMNIPPPQLPPFLRRNKG